MSKKLRRASSLSHNESGFSKNSFIVAFLILLLTVGVAAFLQMRNAVQEKLSSQKSQNTNDGGQTQGQGTVLPRVSYNLSGRVEAVNESVIILDALVFGADSTGDTVKMRAKRTALITPSTKITKLTFMPVPGTNRQTPQERVVTISEVSVGEAVEVISNQDISGKEQFTATHVRILP